MPNSLLLEIVELLDAKSVLNVGRVNKAFSSLTNPLRLEIRHVRKLINCVKHLDKFELSNPALQAGGDRGAKSSEFPRMTALKTILTQVDLEKCFQTRALVLDALASNLDSLFPRNRRFDAFHEVFMAAAKLPKTQQASILVQLATKLDMLIRDELSTKMFRDLLDATADVSIDERALLLAPLARNTKIMNDEPSRTDAFYQILRAMEQVPPQGRAPVAVALAHNIYMITEGQERTEAYNRILAASEDIPVGSRAPVSEALVSWLNNITDGQEKIDAYNRILATSTNLPATCRGPVLKWLATKLDVCSEKQSMFDAYMRILAATVDIPHDCGTLVFQRLADHFSRLPLGRPRTVAFNGILDANAFKNIQDKHCVLDRLASEIGTFAEGQERLIAFNRILTETREIPSVKKGYVLLPLALQAYTLGENEGIDAFSRVLNETEFMPVENDSSDEASRSGLIEKCLFRSSSDRTLNQMRGEFNAIRLVCADHPSRFSGGHFTKLADSAHIFLKDSEQRFIELNRMLVVTKNESLINTDEQKCALLEKLIRWIPALSQEHKSRIANDFIATINTISSIKEKAELLETATKHLA